MYPENVTKRQQGLWIAAALLVPVIQAASRCSWLTVMTVGTGVGVINILLPKYLNCPGKCLAQIQGLWNCVVISQFLKWNAGCWPSHEQPYGASLILLFLAGWSVKNGKKRNGGIGCILLWPMILLLAAVLLSGVPEVKIQRLSPRWSMPDAWLVVVGLIPLLAAQKETGTKGKQIGAGYLVALIAAAVVSGVLSTAVSGATEVPVYELSRSIGVLGAGERMESLTAVAMTLGYYTAIGYLLSLSAEEDERKVWYYALISGVLYLTGIIRDDRIAAVGCILVWMVFPILESLGNSGKKREKTLDN